ncbi:hypothetical protein K491DRAFT_692998 [Lophiostoma macrostomum CBS 122681]|uniref:Uncharacterized protein n=1 Tax=Lophiostoma macrostomum CBS 122681 TaxID=1314788 RepID=A0A6A6T9Z3_9PLEO|nr:hypothetical protein K491DRAFT_692998 [Lophiostoma macrostomum CBS 122681]
MLALASCPVLSCIASHHFLFLVRLLLGWHGMDKLQFGVLPVCLAGIFFGLGIEQDRKGAT